MRRALLLGLITALLVLGPPSAYADAPAQAVSLCSDAPNGCAIQVADVTREGATFPVTVQGRPQTRVRIVAYQAIADGAELQELKPLGAGVELLTSSSGVAKTELTIPAVVEDRSSGWVLISVDGVEGTDVSLTVGAFAPFGARIPTVLGDGYSEEKPVGETLELQIVGAIAGTRYAVELQSDDGSWADLTQGTGYVQSPPDEVATIRYMLPRGLSDTSKKLRLRNLTDSATDAVWHATPSSDGKPADRERRFTPPPVGDALDGTALLASHPTETVRFVATGIAAGSVGFVAMALTAEGLLRRRRRG